MFIILGADGKEYGPVPPRKIHEWIHEGRANLETKAKRVDETEWKTLGQFAEFGGRPATQPPVDVVPPPLNASTPSLPLSTAPADEPAFVETPPASLARRFIAAAIDGLLKTLCLLPVTIPWLRFVAERSRDGETLSLQEAIQSTSQILNEHAPKAFPFLAGLLALQMVLITVRGQSVGKLFTGVRIVRAGDEEPAGFFRGFVLRSVLPFMVEQLPLLGLVFRAVDACFIFREDRRCLHDLAAGTKVIPAKKRQS